MSPPPALLMHRPLLLTHRPLLAAAKRLLELALSFLPSGSQAPSLRSNSSRTSGGQEPGSGRSVIRGCKCCGSYRLHRLRGFTYIKYGWSGGMKLLCACGAGLLLLLWLLLFLLLSVLLRWLASALVGSSCCPEGGAGRW